MTADRLHLPTLALALAAVVLLGCESPQPIASTREEVQHPTELKQLERPSTADIYQGSPAPYQASAATDGNARSIDAARLETAIRAYSGDGRMGMLQAGTRANPRAAGYIVQLPTFRVDSSFETTWSLAGMPNIGVPAKVEIVTYLPTNAERDSSRPAPPPPLGHRIHCRVIRRSTGRVIAEKEGTLTSLPASDAPNFAALGFVKHILDLPPQHLDSDDLAIQFFYYDGDKPAPASMCVMVVADLN